MKVDLKRFRKAYNLKQGDLADMFNCRQSNISEIERNNKELEDYQRDILIEKYGLIEVEKYIIDDGNTSFDFNTGRNLIPLYNDVASFGNTKIGGDVSETHSSTSEYIDTGDWFRDATAAIRHYGESMTEYPSGCILALREVKDKNLIVPGRDYMIETDEYRVTKRIQLGKDDDHFMAYSTNPETYADGRLIHEPFPIAKQSIRRMALVLGYVVNKNGGTLVFSKKGKM